MRVSWIPKLYQITQEDFHMVIGHSSDLAQNKNGTGPISTSHMENGTELQKLWYSTSLRAGIPYSVAQVRLKEEPWRVKEVGSRQNTSVAMPKLLKIFFAQSFL